MRHAPDAPVLAPRGLDLSTKGWPQETTYRLPLNNLKVAEGRNRLFVNADCGKAARDRDCCFRTIDMLGP